MKLILIRWIVESVSEIHILIKAFRAKNKDPHTLKSKPPISREQAKG